MVTSDLNKLAELAAGYILWVDMANANTFAKAHTNIIRAVEAQKDNVLLVFDYTHASETDIASCVQWFAQVQSMVVDSATKFYVAVIGAAHRWQERDQIENMVTPHQALLAVADAEFVEGWVTLAWPWRTAFLKGAAINSANFSLTLSNSVFEVDHNDLIIDDQKAVRAIHHQCVAHGHIAKLVEAKDIAKVAILDMPVVQVADQNNQNLLDLADRIGLLSGYSVLGPLVEGCYPMEMLQVIPQIQNYVFPGDLQITRTGLDLAIVSPTGGIALQANIADNNQILSSDSVLCTWGKQYGVNCVDIEHKVVISRLLPDIDAIFNLPIALLETNAVEHLEVLENILVQGVDLRGRIINAE